MTIQTNLKAFQECVNRVSDILLPFVLEPVIQKSIFQATNKLVNRQLKKNTPVRTGGTRRAVKSRVKEAKRRRITVHRVAKKPVDLKTFYGLVGYNHPQGNLSHFLEGGTKERRHRSGKSVGRIKPVRMLQRALDTTEKENERAIEAGLNKGIQKAEAKGNTTIRLCNLGRLSNGS